jgi:signal peptidase
MSIQTADKQLDLPPVHRHEPRSAGAKKVTKVVAWVLFWVLMATITVLTLLVFVIPRSQAGSGLTILTGSMAPAYQPGDIVAVRGIKTHEVCQTVRPGDVIAFMPNADDPATIVTHRVVDVYDHQGYEDCMLTTRGDANNADDPPIPARAVKGVVMYSVPKLGYALERTQQVGTPLIMLGGAAACMVIAAYLLVPRKPKLPRDPDYSI